MTLRGGGLYASLWALMTVAAMARGAVGEGLFGLAAAAGFWAPLFAVGLWIGHANARAGRKPLKRVTEGVAAVGLGVFLLLLAIAGLVPALLTLVLWIQAAQNFSLARERDVYFALAISFAVFISAAAESKTTVFLVWVVLYALAATFVLVGLHSEHEGGRARAVAGANRRLPLPAGTAFLTTSILAIALTLYLFVPQPPAKGVGGFYAGGGPFYENEQWESEAEARESGGSDAMGDGSGGGGSGPEDASGDTRGEEGQVPRAGDQSRGEARQPSDYRGFDDTLPIENPGRGGQGGESGGVGNGIVMYVRADRPLYLRGRVFDTFADGRWSTRHTWEEKLPVDTGGLKLRPHPDGAGVSYTVEVASPSSDLVFVVPQALALKFPGTAIARDVHGSLRAPDTLEAGTRYSVRSRIETVDGHPKGAQASITDPAAYLQLPPGLDARIERLAREVADGRDGLEAALALESHLRTSYEYSFRSVFTSQGYTPLEYFLFEAERGHCEYFASALAVMLRTLDIPSRLVTGFSATDRNPVTGYYEVRGLDGHAWVEAYFPEHGWVQFEPTPFYALPNQERQADTVGAGLLDYLRAMTRNARQVAPEAESTQYLVSLNDWLERLQAWYRSAMETLRAALPALGLWLLLPGVLAVAVLAGLWAGWRHLRLPIVRRLARWRVERARRAGPKALVLACFREAERMLACAGYPRDRATTVSEYTEGIINTEVRGLADPLAVIGEAFILARYSDRNVAAEDADRVYRAFRALMQGTGAGRRRSV
ncbi:transglutaminase TgpA family protein [Arhodomonas sp. AD133]|uniref:transglutaminase TgpA family protein n=1 Tax=Arhodomonas sp. AD133 TaxID=3415009 RepID=UPI003EBDC7E2